MAPSKRPRAAPRDADGDPRKERLPGAFETKNTTPQSEAQGAGDCADWPSGYLDAHAQRFLPIVYRDDLVPADALEGSAEAPRQLGENAQFSLKIATIQRAHAQKAIAQRWQHLTPGDLRAALVEMKRAGLQFEAAYYAGESDTRPCRWGDPTASNMVCRGTNAPYRALNHVPAAFRKAALEAAAHLP